MVSTMDNRLVEIIREERKAKKCLSEERFCNIDFNINGNHLECEK